MPSSEQRLQTAERRRKVIALRRAGASVRDIARQLELSETRVRNDIAHALANLQEQTLEDANQLRVLELARLDEMQATLWQKVRDGNLKAVDRVMRIMERRSRLMGLDAAARMEHTGRVDHTLQIPKEAVDELEELWRKTIEGESYEEADIPEVELIGTGDSTPDSEAEAGPS